MISHTLKRKDMEGIRMKARYYGSYYYRLLRVITKAVIVHPCWIQQNMGCMKRRS